MRRALLALALLTAPAWAEPPPPGSATWFGIHYIDTSTEGQINGVRADETARIEMIRDYVAEALAARGFALREPEPE